MNNELSRLDTTPAYTFWIQAVALNIFMKN
jgi:hypothetical protein